MDARGADQIDAQTQQRVEIVCHHRAAVAAQQDGILVAEGCGDFVA